MGAGFLLIMRTGAVRVREILVEGITRTSYVFLKQRKRTWCVERDAWLAKSQQWWNGGTLKTEQFTK
jgi:hypothetical protein